jgi:hypothetical protein
MSKEDFKERLLMHLSEFLTDAELIEKDKDTWEIDGIGTMDGVSGRVKIEIEAPEFYTRSNVALYIESIIEDCQFPLYNLSGEEEEEE